MYLDTEVVSVNGLLNLIQILEKLICIKESYAEVLIKRFGEWLTSGKFHVIILTSHTERLVDMIKYFVIFIAGGIFFTVGFSGIARMLDKGVDTVKTHSQEMAK
jgi:hypothetical protein